MDVEDAGDSKAGEGCCALSCLDFVLVEIFSALTLFCFDKDSCFMIIPFFLIEGSSAKTQDPPCKAGPCRIQSFQLVHDEL